MKQQQQFFPWGTMVSTPTGNPRVHDQGPGHLSLTLQEALILGGNSLELRAGEVSNGTWAYRTGQNSPKTPVAILRHVLRQAPAQTVIDRL